jgi:hypothetical protein
MEREETR